MTTITIKGKDYTVHEDVADLILILKEIVNAYISQGYVDDVDTLMSIKNLRELNIPGGYSVAVKANGMLYDCHGIQIDVRCRMVIFETDNIVNQPEEDETS